MNKISPPYLLIYTSIIAIAAILFPPQVYEKLISEKSLMFLNPTLAIFYSTCSAAFLLGYKIIEFLIGNLNLIEDDRKSIQHENLPLKLIIITVALNIISIYQIYSSNEDLILLIATQQGGLAKDELNETGIGGLTNFASIGIFWYCYHNYLRSQESENSKERSFQKILLLTLLTTIFVSSTIKLSRGELMPFLAGAALVYVNNKFSDQRNEGVKFGLFILKACAFVFFIFSIFSSLRGEAEITKIIADFIGYTLASYNRLSGILDGRLQFEFTGTGVYLSSFLSFNNSLNRFLPISEYMNWPRYFDLWNSEFLSVSAAGFNEYLIWPTAIGYIFIDLGWFSPIILFLYGMLYAGVWHSWKRGSPLGIILYPWLGFCLLFWFGTNYLLDTKFFVLLIISIIISIINHLNRPSSVSIE